MCTLKAILTKPSLRECGKRCILKAIEEVQHQHVDCPTHNTVDRQCNKDIGNNNEKDDIDLITRYFRPSKLSTLNKQCFSLYK